MADNTHYYGFRWARSYNGKECPSPILHTVATGYSATAGTASTAVSLSPGDPVKLVAGGGVELCAAGNGVYGIVTAVAPYYDGTKMVPGTKLPAGTAWGTVEERRSYVYVVPARAGYWEIDVDDKTTATTKAAYVALLGSIADHALPASGATADPMLDISTFGTTGGGQWRIDAISNTVDNRYFDGLYVKLIVRVNESQEAGSPATALDGI